MGAPAAAVIAVVVVVVIAVIIVHHHLLLLLGHLGLPMHRIFPLGQLIRKSRQVHGMFDNVEIARGTGSIDGVKERTNTAVIWWVMSG